ncbi:hypothetical protein Tco_1347480 [Tanacetum coccineum]
MWPVNSPDAVTGASTGQRWRSTAVNDGAPLQDHRRTTTGQPVNHCRTTGQRWLTASQWWVNGGHVAGDVAANVA